MNILKDSEIRLEQYNFIENDGDNPTTYQFYIVTNIDGIKVGKCSFRVGDIDNRHVKYGGNIGYDVDEPYRGNKYSLKSCKLLLNIAKLHNMDSVRITCEPDNTASRRICELLGAEYIATIDLPKDDYNYIHNGTKEHCIYNLPLKYNKKE